MIRRVLGNLYFLTFLNGFLLASLFYFKMEANYEQEIFQAIHADINNKIKFSDSQDSVVAKVMHECHNLMVNRGSVFVGKQFNGIKSDLLDPTSFDLLTANGACGSFSMVLARMLQEFDYDTRIAQMKSKGKYAAHNIVEVRTNHGWVVLDALYDVYFVKPSRELASFDDVKNNWDYYRTQLPPAYDTNYRYENVRYSNWTKVPVVMPAVKKIMELALGKKKADEFSMRTYFLRKYVICFNVMMVIFLFVFSFTVVRLIKAKVFPQPNIPITFSNVYKYLRQRLFNKKFTEQGNA
jgi:hypothetical protein